MMKRVLISIVLGCITLALIFVVGVGIFFSTLNLNDYKTTLEKAVAKATGKHVIFEGDISYSLFPLGLKTGRAYIYDEIIYGSDPMFFVDGIYLKANIRSLLHAEVTIEELVLQNPIAKLAVSATGQKNWEKPVERSSPHTGSVVLQEETLKKTPVKPKHFLKLSIESVLVKGGKFVYRDLREKKLWEMDIQQLDIKNIGDTADILFKGLLTGMGKQATVELSAGAKKMPEGNIAIDILLLRLQPVGKENTLPEVTASGSVFYTGVMKSLAINDLNGTIDKSPFSGTFSLIFPGGENLQSGDSYDVRGEIHCTTLDIDELARKLAVAPLSHTGLKQPTVNGVKPLVVGSGAMNKNDSKGTTRHEQSASASEAMPFLASLYAELDVTVDRVVVGKSFLQHVVAKPLLNNGVLDMPFNAQGYGGHIQGTMNAKLLKDKPPFNLNITATDIKAELLPVKIAKEKKLHGIIFAQAKLHGQGFNKSSLLASLSGSGSVKLHDGKVNGFNLIPAELAGKYAIPDSFFIENASCTAHIMNGVIKSQDITVHAHDLSANAVGSVNLRNDHIALDINIKSKRSPAIPLTVRGTISTPVYAVDMGQLIRNLAETGLESGDGKKLLKKIPPSLGNVLKNENLLKKVTQDGKRR